MVIMDELDFGGMWFQQVDVMVDLKTRINLFGLKFNHEIDLFKSKASKVQLIHYGQVLIELCLP